MVNFTNKTRGRNLASRALGPASREIYKPRDLGVIKEIVPGR
jgi:hypothetical protein